LTVFGKSAPVGAFLEARRAPDKPRIGRFFDLSRGNLASNPATAEAPSRIFERDSLGDRRD
jgi:hypothetical protein